MTVGFLTSATMARFSTVTYIVPVSQQASGLVFNAGRREAVVPAQKRQLDHEKQLSASVNHDICE